MSCSVIGYGVDREGLGLWLGLTLTLTLNVPNFDRFKDYGDPG